MLLFVCGVSMLRECKRDEKMLVWGTWEVLLRGVSIWVVHVVQVLCTVQ